jgi:hypothetical protein
MPTRSEDWKGLGRVSVSRDGRGRFVHWERVTSLFMEKAVTLYQTAITRQGRQEMRYEITGSGRDVYRAIAIAMYLPPKRRFTVVEARDFLSNHGMYGDAEARWVARPNVVS